MKREKGSALNLRKYGVVAIASTTTTKSKMSETVQIAEGACKRTLGRVKGGQAHTSGGRVGEFCKPQFDVTATLL